MAGMSIKILVCAMPLLLALSSCGQGAESETDQQLDRAERAESIEMTPSSEYQELLNAELFSASRIPQPWQNVSPGIGRLDFDVPVELLNLPLNEDLAEGRRQSESQTIITATISWPFFPKEANRGMYSVTSPDQFYELVNRGHLSPTGYFLDTGSAGDALQFFTRSYDNQSTAMIFNENATVQCRSISGSWVGEGAIVFRAPNPFFYCQLTKWDNEFQVYFRVPGYLYREIGNIAQRVEQVALEARNSGGE